MEWRDTSLALDVFFPRIASACPRPATVHGRPSTVAAWGRSPRHSKLHGSTELQSFKISILTPVGLFGLWCLEYDLQLSPFLSQAAMPCMKLLR